MELGGHVLKVLVISREGVSFFVLFYNQLFQDDEDMISYMELIDKLLAATA